MAGIKNTQITHKIPFWLSCPLPLIFTHHAIQHCHQLNNYTSIECLLRIQIWALLVGIQKYAQALQVPGGAYLSNEKSQIIQECGHWRQKASSRQLLNGKSASKMNYRSNCDGGGWHLVM